MSDGGYTGPGVYEHYKGGRYRVLGLGMREATKESLEQDIFVAYEPLTPGSILEGTDCRFWLRQIDNFNDSVDIPQGTTAHAGSGGDIVPRFRRIDSDEPTVIASTAEGNSLQLAAMGNLPIGRIVSAEFSEKRPNIESGIRHAVASGVMDPELAKALEDLLTLVTCVKDGLLVHLGEA